MNKQPNETMKTTLSTSQAVKILLQDEYADWSYNGATALIEFIDELGEDQELDTVALRCDFNEYDSISDAVLDYDTSLDLDGMGEDEVEEAQREWLSDQTLLIEFEGGVIIHAF